MQYIEFTIGGGERIRCDGCGKLVKNDDVLLFPETSWEYGGAGLKFSHARPECISKVEEEEEIEARKQKED